MREILFRGKRKDNGEWVYGDLIQLLGERGAGRKLIVNNKFGACIDADGNFINTEAPFVCLVDNDTISQYIGLCDKSSPYVNCGKKIFEGDIIRCVDTENCIEFVGEVKYYAEDDKYPAFDIDIPLEEKYRFESNVLQTMLLTGWYIEVIGNKRDNPELLKKEN